MTTNPIKPGQAGTSAAASAGTTATATAGGTPGYPTVDVVMKCCPDADPKHVAQFLALVMPMFAAKGWTSKNQLTGLLATISVETTTFAPILEAMSKYVARYEGNVRDLGNTQPGDGKKFRGRGYCQTTGRGGYAKASKLIGIDVVSRPELLETHSEATARVLVLTWEGKLGTGISAAKFAERGEWLNVRKAINGWGKNPHGLPKFNKVIARCQQFLTGGISGNFPLAGNYGANDYDPGSGGDRVVAGVVNPASQLDALGYALGLHEMDRARTHEFRATIDVSAQPDVLNLSAGKTFVVRGMGAADTTTDDVPTESSAELLTGSNAVMLVGSSSGSAADVGMLIARAGSGAVPTLGQTIAPPGKAPTAADRNKAAEGAIRLDPKLFEIAAPTGGGAVATNSNEEAKQAAVASPVGAPPKGDRNRVLLRVKFGDLEFTNLKGDFLYRPFVPSVRSATYVHDQFRIVINDPDDVHRIAISEHRQVEVAIGFVNGDTINKFIGEIYHIGRIQPGGLEIRAVDMSFSKMAGAATGVVDQTMPTQVDTREVLSAESGDAAVIAEQRKGQVMTNGSPYDPTKAIAAHRTIPLGSEVRITALATNKSTIAIVSDRGPKSGNAKIEVSSSVAAAIGLGKPTASLPSRSGSSAAVATTAGSGAAGAIVSPAAVRIEVLKPKDGALGGSVAGLISGFGDAFKSTGGAPTTTTPATPQGNQVSMSSADLFSRAIASAATQAGSSNALLEQIRSKYQQQATVLQQLGAAGGLQYKGGGAGLLVSSMGQAFLGQSPGRVAQSQSLLQGNTTTVSGNTVKENAPGKGEPSGVVLDYTRNRPAFVQARAWQRTGIQLQSGYGALTVKGWNPTEKEVVSATVVTPGPAPVHPTGSINVPGWGKTILNQPIVPGGKYTWGDATKNGSRTPGSNGSKLDGKTIMQNMSKLAQTMETLCSQFNGGNKLAFSSWYRDPVSNRSAGGRSASQHMVGWAIDITGKFSQIHSTLSKTWKGGIAISPGSFTHVDLYETNPPRRWSYGK